MARFLRQWNKAIALACVCSLTMAFGQTQVQPPATPPATQAAGQPATQPAAQTATQPAQPAITVPGGLNLNNAPLLEVINLLATDLHINYVLDAKVKGGSVTINTYGTVKDVDLRPLLETILRMNGLAMVQAGNIYRIVPVADIARQPISPTSQVDPGKIPDDERFVLNLVFLKYVTSAEMSKVLTAFIGEGAQLTNYDPANLLIILDNSRNMRRTLEMINLFDNETLAGQRVHTYQVKNGRPSDIAKELDSVFKAMSFSDKNGAVRFLPIERINTILAIAPNPGIFPRVEEWLKQLDIPAKATAGAIDNYVYKLKYARAEIIGMALMQLYGGSGGGMGMGGNMYGGGANGGAGMYGQGMYGQGMYGQGMNGSGMGGGFGGGMGAGAGMYGGGGANGMAGGYGNAGAGQPVYAPPLTGVFGGGGAGGGGTTGAAGATGNTTGTATGTPDQTGTYMGSNAESTGGYGRMMYPRIVPNPYDNTIIVQGTPQHWEQIRHLMEQLDIAPRQVQIDAKIYEVDLTGDFSSGVEAFLQKKGAASTVIPGGTQLLGASTGTALQLTAGMLVGHSRQLLALLNASESKTRTKVISAPTVVATDSISASITVGSEVPTLASQALAGGLQQGGNSLFTNTIQSKSTGVGLQILARVNPSGVVTMVINQDVTAPVPTTTSNIDSPSFSKRNVQTQVTVEDGDTIAIGGIIQETATESSSGIPYLHRIPILGAAFGGKTSTKQRTELIVFLTPRVIYDTTQSADITEEIKSKMKILQKLMKD